MVEISKVPVICRRAFYADLATAGAAVGMGGAADAAVLAALQAATEPAQLDPDYADLDPELVVDPRWPRTTSWPTTAFSTPSATSAFAIRAIPIAICRCRRSRRAT